MWTRRAGAISVFGAPRRLAAGLVTVLGRVRGAVLARLAARVLYGRDRVFEDELLLRSGFEQHGVLIEAADAPRELRPVHQVDRHGVLFPAHRVQERVLYVLGS